MAKTPQEYRAAFRCLAQPSKVGEEPDALPPSGTGAVLDAIPAEVAILDAGGRVLATNAAWRRFEEIAGFQRCADITERLERDRAASTSSTAQEVACGVRKVARGEHEEFRLVYPSLEEGEVRWFRVRATRFFQCEEVRVLIFHEEVTDWKRTERALDELTEHLLVAQDEERRRIAREIHDATVPNMVGLSLELARLTPLLHGELRTIGDDCTALCEQSLRELRTASFLLHPPALERIGLVAALHWLADGFGRRAGIGLSLETSGEKGTERFSPAVELALYRIAQEALVNVHRHTSSRTAQITLTLGPGEARLTVSDEGNGGGGWDVEGDGNGVGISGMRERLRALGGRLEIRTGVAGTVVDAVVPRQAKG